MWWENASDHSSYCVGAAACFALSEHGNQLFLSPQKPGSVPGFPCGPSLSRMIARDKLTQNTAAFADLRPQSGTLRREPCHFTA